MHTYNVAIHIEIAHKHVVYEVTHVCMYFAHTNDLIRRRNMSRIEL